MSEDVAAASKSNKELSSTPMAASLSVEEPDRPEDAGEEQEATVPPTIKLHEATPVPEAASDSSKDTVTDVATDSETDKAEQESITMASPATSTKDLPSAPPPAEVNGEAATPPLKSDGQFENVSLDATPTPKQASRTNGPSTTSLSNGQSSLAYESRLSISSSNDVTAVPSPTRPTFRERSETESTISSVNDGRPRPLLSGVLIVSSLEQIMNHKDARKNQPLRDASKAALDSFKAPASNTASSDPRAILEPLKLACETTSNALTIIALDCIGKLVSHAGFATTTESPSSQPSSQAPSTPTSPQRSRTSMGLDGANVPGTTFKADPDLATYVVDIICSCFIDTSGGSSATTSSASSNAVNDPTGPDAVNLHILSALLSLILSGSSNLPVHQSALLNAVRTVYNIFLLSRGIQNQMVAQGALGQIVAAVFGRVALNQPIPSVSSSTHRHHQRTHGQRDRPVSTANSSVDDLSASASPKIQHRENGDESRLSGETVREDVQPAHPEGSVTDTDLTTSGRPINGTRSEGEARESNANGSNETDDSTPRVTLASFEQGTSNFDTMPDTNVALAPNTNETYTRDAFLVFRALCKLSMKPLGSESERDIRSHAMRSKLLSLHLVLTILHNHMPLFVDPTVTIYQTATRERLPFIATIKQYLCLSLSRNALSPVINVFELACEIFWRVLAEMRTKLKPEIEVLMKEIFLPIMEMKTSTVRQKSILLAVLARLCHEPQALVEIYINYDCDSNSIENIYERLMNIIARTSTTQYTTITHPTSTPLNDIIAAPPPSALSPPPPNAPHPAGLGTAWTAETAAYGNMPYELRLKRQSLEALVFTLRSLVAWAGKDHSGPSTVSQSGSAAGTLTATETDDRRKSSSDHRYSTSDIDLHVSGYTTPDLADDPSRFESAKQQKTTLLEGIRKFNFKPKRGIAFFLQHGFIESGSPEAIAKFLLNSEGLSKAAIGEYLGEGDEENVAAMHAFVDIMDFTNMRFVDALRSFLQSFRLPGESQKIDRFMLKFADRYVIGNPKAFANADTAYVLAYSVIMLNTDLYNPQNKARMSKQEFIRNNRGIDDGKDLDENLLNAIYDEIATNEIRMKDEIDLSVAQPATGIAGALAGVGRNFQREAYHLESEGMLSKTEGLFKSLNKASRKSLASSTSSQQRVGASEQYFSASHYEHVRPMFTAAWMPMLAGISGPLQDSDDFELVSLSLEGFKQAIKIVCLFDLELERNAFVTTLAKFTFLNNLSEMKTKNVEAIRTLLDIAAVDGNFLKGSWREVMMCVSQLERFQLITSGPNGTATGEASKRVQNSRQNSSKRSSVNKPSEEVAYETRSSQVTIAADRIFATSSTLSGSAIVDFAQALADVSWDEIQSSGLTEHPRTFCLQKLVEISYYNMNRIRLEWSSIWAILGEHFNQVCCHTNVKVSFFALDSLRQLASRFLEKEELAHFKFQKDFLKPFEYAMEHNPNPEVRDMILQCLRQMVQARASTLRSGWRTMFGVFSAASKVMAERIASQAFDMVKSLNREHFGRIVTHGAFADLAVCITDFCKIAKYQKISLHAIEMLKGLVASLLVCPECPLSQALPEHVDGEPAPVDDPMIKYWFPVLFGFYDIIMNGEDMEVRKRSLDYLFETLKEHGHAFPTYFWDSVCKEVLFPIFAVLRSRQDVSRFSTHEDMSVWLSTTMIQALRNLVDLFTFYFDVLGRMMDKLLDLLCECICQENDTLARIGTACLQQLVEKNVRKLTPSLWSKIVHTFITLFQTTTAHSLFDERLRLPASPGATDNQESAPPSGFVAPLPLSPSLPPASDQRSSSTAPLADRKRAFRQIIVKCVLQLLLIETAHELLQNEEVYTTIPPADLLRLMGVLDESYRFAKRFNADKELRMSLWKVGFMKQLPNLLKQESSSAATLVTVLLRMYNDSRPDHVAKRADTVAAYTPLGVQIVANYVSLDGETQARNIAAWTPVVVEVLQGFSSFEDATLTQHVTVLYPLAVDLLSRDMAPEVRESLRGLFYRVGVVQGIIQEEDSEDDEGDEDGSGAT